MNTEQFLKFHQDFTDKCRKIVECKNHDYTSGSKSNAFANFIATEQLGITTTEQGFLTRITDKLMRISTFVNKGTLKVEDEKIDDTLRDLVNYVILMAGYIEFKKNKTYLPNENAIFIKSKP